MAFAIWVGLCFPSFCFRSLLALFHIFSCAPCSPRPLVYLGLRLLACAAYGKGDMSRMHSLQSRRSVWACRGVVEACCGGGRDCCGWCGLVSQVPVFFEPTSVPKAVAAAEEGVMGHVTFVSPNEAELEALGAFGLEGVQLLGSYRHYSRERGTTGRRGSASPERECNS